MEGKNSSQALYKFLYDVISRWRLDNQETEGVNSILKYITGVCPNITFKLLSSRITIKKLVNKCEGRAEREALLQDCEFYYSFGHDEMRCLRERFSEPRPDDYPPTLDGWDALPRVIKDVDYRMLLVAKVIAALKVQLAARELVYSGTSSYQLLFEARVGCAGKSFEEVWAPSMLYGNTLWLTESAFSRDIGTAELGAVSFALPLEHRIQQQI